MTMKYMIMMFGSAATMMETQPREWILEMIEFMHQLDEDLRNAGELVSSDGLADGTQAKTVTFQDGITVVTAPDSVGRSWACTTCSNELRLGRSSPSTAPLRSPWWMGHEPAWPCSEPSTPTAG